MRIQPLLIGLIVGSLAFAISSCKKSNNAAPPQPPAALDAAAIEANDQAVGLMGKYLFDEAMKSFGGLAEKFPSSDDVQLNLAIATLNRQQPGDSERAMALIDVVLVRNATHPRGRYCKGLLLLNGGKPAEALSHFQFVAQADPSDAYASYYVGQCLANLDKPKEALDQYEKALKLDPYLRSAYYGAFQALQQLQRPQDAKLRFDEFQKLKDNPQARLVEFKYTRMGPKGEAVTLSPSDKSPLTVPPGPPFADPKPIQLTGTSPVKWRAVKDAAPDITITACDIDGDSKLDLFITHSIESNQSFRHAVLLQRDGGAFELAVSHPLASITETNAVLWGDIDNDGLTDAYFCRKSGNQLWRQVKKNEWQNITDASKTAAGQFNTVNGAMFDADHDGDLDLLLIRSNSPTELLSNNLDGTFRPIAAEAGIAGDGREATGLLVNDLDNDGDADIVILKKDPPHDVFLNDRLWTYRKAETWLDFRSNSARIAIATDRDADGQVEIYTEILDWQANQPQKARSGLPWQLPADFENVVPRLHVADIQGSGRLSILIPTKTAIQILPIGSAPSFSVASPTITTFTLANLAPTSGPSLIAYTHDKGPILFSPGPGRLPFFSLSFSGKHNDADQMRSNASGIGVKLAARSASRWIAADTYPRSSSPGQSLQPLSLGLGAKDATFIRLTWPDGLLQTETDLLAGKHYDIQEIQRQTSSCPVLFAWNGREWVFVTDALGVGGLGFATGKGEYAPPRPWENLLLPANLLVAKEGRYQLKLTEPMEEACYLDSARLVRYELPPGWQMTLDERMGINDPQPTGKPFFYRRSVSPNKAQGANQQDVTAILAFADGKAADPGRRDPRFLGFTEPYTITLQFPQPLDEGEGNAVLIADAWIEYPYSQTMFAAWQANVPYQAPSLEARGEDGQWVVVLDQFGYPAGMPRQMSVPIPREKLPHGTKEIRLRTNLEIYWDRIFIAYAEPCPDARRIEHPLHAARLAETGFAHRINLPHRRPHYDYSRREPLWNARHQDGFYTRFGQIESLVKSDDEALAIFGPGEEIHLEFSASSPALSSTGSTHFVLELVGWCKDADFYTKDGQTLAPLPFRDSASHFILQARDALHQQYNTRYRSGG